MYISPSKLDKFLLKRIFSKLITQGNHEENLILIYQMIRESCEKEFYEDNPPTLRAFMQECFDKSFKDKF